MIQKVYLNLDTVHYILSFFTIHELIANNGYLILIFIPSFNRSLKEYYTASGVSQRSSHFIFDAANETFFSLKEYYTDSGVSQRSSRYIFDAANETFFPEFFRWKAEYEEPPHVCEHVAELICTYGALELANFIRADNSFINHMIRLSMNQLLQIRILPLSETVKKAAEPIAKLEHFLQLLTTAFEPNITDILIAGSFMLKSILVKHPMVTFSPKDIDIYVELSKYYCD